MHSARAVIENIHLAPLHHLRQVAAAAGRGRRLSRARGVQYLLL